jgi:hypothetical protein
MQIVNGYVCMSSCDATLAAKGVDPAHPKDDPTKADPARKTDPAKPDSGVTAAKASDASDSARGAQPAVILSGAVASADASNGQGSPFGQSQGAPGRLFSITA